MSDLSDLSGLLGRSAAIAVVDDPNNVSSSPMHTKEFQILSESTVDPVVITGDTLTFEFIETEGEVVEFVDVPTDVHPISEVSCGTSCPFFECFVF